ncbi:3-deoxy-8-phosphooctulonate synthase [Agrobacterium pusense]|uniref:3-deoxy-8-phosphooctulonate synthase n=1 Tax=Agrobacterium pusense TaxID=648995 RepID=UPI0028A6909B|nr:3-deoxy-8-phosphooctulonate synthase [Agrobacterium pusense]
MSVTNNLKVTAGQGASKVSFCNSERFSLIAGPCQMESREHAFMIAGVLKELCDGLGIGLVYKSEVVDVLQIPAFLSRQTDLLVAAAKTGRVINVKKGQFLAPWDMKNVLAKLNESGNPNVLLCERGASFGYNTLISDMRSLPIMASLGAPVVFDATHSVQQPGGQGGSTGGQREFVETLSRAAVAVGVAGLFIETHEDPDNAPSDGPNMVHLKDMPKLLEKLLAFDAIAKA